jgi:F-type H+-transporting ATPase subunit epsilon
MLHLRILATDRTVFNDTADEITLTTESGVIGVLGGHSPLVTIIRPGKMSIKKDEKVFTYTISGGVLEVRPGSQVIVLATTIESDTVEV